LVRKRAAAITLLETCLNKDVLLNVPQQSGGLETCHSKREDGWKKHMKAVMGMYQKLIWERGRREGKTRGGRSGGVEGDRGNGQHLQLEWRSFCMAFSFLEKSRTTYEQD
jgi:hypothetical protein